MIPKKWLYILYLIVFIAILDFTFGKIYESLYFSENSKQNDRLIHSVIGTDEEILIFGSSRALHHYNPKIIEDSLGMTCYNVGAGGQNIYFHLAILKSAIERYIPKIAILELMSIDFEVTPPQWDTEKLGSLLPFVDYSNASKDAVLLRTKQEKLKLFSNIYPFNSLQYIIFRNNLFPFQNHINGFIPIDKIWNKPIEHKDVKPGIIDNTKMAVLYNFIEICQRNSIQLFVFVSPYYADLKGKSTYIEVSKQLKEKYDISVLNFENDSLFKVNPGYFADPLHLNKAGTEVFTAYVIQSIKQSKSTK